MSVAIMAPRASTKLYGQEAIMSLTWQPGLLDEIRSYVAATYLSRSGRGEEVGGVLFGYRCDESVKVMTWRPIQRGIQATAHFELNAQEEQGLSRQLEQAGTDSSLSSMEVLGWFRSRNKGQAEMDEQDVRFHEKFFGGPSQFAMMIRPSHQRPSEAAIYLRNEENQFALKKPAARLFLQARSLDLVVEVDVDAKGEREDFGNLSMPWLEVAGAILAGLILTLGLLSLLQWNSRRDDQAKVRTGLGFEVSIDGDDLKARWNPSSTAIQESESAQLLLGEDRLQLSHSELAQGFLRVPMNSRAIQDTKISFKVGEQIEFAQIIVASR